MITQHWGRIPYLEAWDKQEALFQHTIELKKQGLETQNVFILCEHPHVYTLGKSGNEQNLLITAQQLQLQEATFIRTNRGGDITYHGPGQIVGYPIFDLEPLHIGLKEYIHRMEEAIIRTMSRWNIACTRLPHATGVWIDAHLPTARKIAAIGVRSSRYVTMHGFALNVNTDLNYFRAINPCGFIDKGVSSMQQELGKEIDIEEVKGELEAQFKALF